MYHSHIKYSLNLCPFLFFFQGVNRFSKDAQVGRDGVRRKDWHDYEAIKRDAARSGSYKLNFVSWTVLRCKTLMLGYI